MSGSKANLSVAACVGACFLLCAATRLDAIGAIGTTETIDRATLQGIVDEEFVAQKWVGVSFAVQVAGKQYFYQRGYADLEKKLPVAKGTRFRLASISKSFCSVLLLGLAQRGKVDLDRDIREWVPSFPKKRWPVTTRQLLGHMGGIRHYRGLEITLGHPSKTLLPAIEIFADEALIAEPGTKYSYSSYGFNLAGCVYEAASGKSFMEGIGARIAKPLGLTTLAAYHHDKHDPTVARGYRTLLGHPIVHEPPSTLYKLPGGGLIASARDLLAFGAALRDRKLLDRATRKQMLTRGRLASGKRTNYGLGIGIGKRSGFRCFGHSGSQQGTSTQYMVVPQLDLVVVLLTNVKGANTNQLVNRIIAAIAAQRTPSGERDKKKRVVL